jgi:dihydroneopterin aldolase
MKQMVSLHGMVFRRTIGLYPEEKLLPNRFEADVEITASAGGPILDYTLIYAAARTVFDKGFSTLEELAEDLFQRLKESFPSVENTKVCIRKYHPPVGGEVHFAQLCLED